MITSFFAYGTLCRGQCLEQLWPIIPVSVTKAWVHGCLYGRPDYPAMRSGNDRVVGELWRFTADAMPQLIEVVDRIEGTDQPGFDNLYDRVIVDVFDSDDLSKFPSPISRAYSYQYANDPVADGFQRILPNPGQHAGFVHWPK